MSTLARLQDWYFAQCDEDWEHSHGIKIDTLDNPGWTLVVDLTDTSLSGKPFSEYCYGLDEAADASGNEWLHCQVKDNKFMAAGGSAKLEEMINAFLTWSDAAA